MKKETFNFKHVTTDTIYAVLREITMEGTCWLAYDRATEFILDQIFTLQPELKAHHSSNTGDLPEELEAVWLELDYELIELCIMLPTMRNLCTDKLFWCAACTKISTEPFTCTHEGFYGINFDGYVTELYN